MEEEGHAPRKILILSQIECSPRSLRLSLPPRYLSVSPFRLFGLPPACLCLNAAVGEHTPSSSSILFLSLPPSRPTQLDKNITRC